MANLASDASCKARKILSIRFVPRNENSRLLNLPRELRDMIYRYTLVQPRKWDKRHAIGCTYQDLYGNGEILPYRISQGDKDPLWIGSDPEALRARACHELCVKRKGLELLRASKQMHDEAGSIFWSHNVFCFENAEVFFTVFRDLPQSVLWKIRKLSLRIIPDFEPSNPYYLMFSFHRCRNSFYRYGTAVAKTLTMMKNIVDLELSFDVLDVLEFKNVCFLNLKTLRCVIMRTISYTSNDLRVSVDAGLTTQLDVEPLRKNARQCNGHERCFCCQEVIWKSYDTARLLEHARTISHRPWYDVIQRKLKSRTPTQTSDKRYFVHLALLNGSRQKVQIWGLPRPPNTVTKQNQKPERAKASLPSQAHSLPAPMMLIDDDEDEIQIPFGRSPRHWRCHVGRQIQRHESKVQQRKKAAQVEAQHQAARQKSVQKKSAKEREKAESEAQAERRVARKRCGR